MIVQPYTKLAQNKVRSNSHSLLILLLKEGTKFSLDYLIMVQYTGRREEKGTLF